MDYRGAGVPLRRVRDAPSPAARHFTAGSVIRCDRVFVLPVGEMVVSWAVATSGLPRATRARPAGVSFAVTLAVSWAWTVKNELLAMATRRWRRAAVTRRAPAQSAAEVHGIAAVREVFLALKFVKLRGPKRLIRARVRFGQTERGWFENV